MAAPAQTTALASREIGTDEREKRERALNRWRELDSEYNTSWVDTHRDIIDFIQPNHGQFDQTDTNRGTRKDGCIINNFASDKARKISSAIDVGVFSEAREWMVVSTEDERHMEDVGNREYCHTFQESMFAGISKIGWYAPNRNAIDDTVGPATGLVLIEEDAKTVARCTHVPVGQYRVGCDSRGEVNVVVRKFTYTAAQMAQEFKPENCSVAVRMALRRQQTQTAKFTVLHIIEERADIEREHGKIDAKNMAWSSIWLEVGQGYSGSVVPGQSDSSLPTGPQGLLRESGYNEQPFYCYRWNTVGQNAYGTDSPGWNGIGDVKQLQDIELGSATMLALLMKPPMNRPDELANASLLPGADNPIPSNSHVKFEPSYELNPASVTVTRAEKAEIERRLNATFFGDVLFLLSDHPQNDPKTAEEIRGIKEERLLQLGGVFARISAQARIALKRMAAIFYRAGMLPDPPQKLLESGRLRIDFVNPLVSAQKALQYGGIQQVVSLAITLAEARKAGDDRLDGDEILDTATEMFGVKPNILYSAEEMAQRRQALAEQANAEAQAKAMPEAAGAINDLSNADPEKLRAMLSQFGPNAVAQGSTAGV